MSDQFDKEAESKGRFFRDLPGREQGNFCKSAFLSGMSGAAGAPMAVPANVSPQTSFGAGAGAKPKMPKMPKTAGSDPTDIWDDPIPSGMHRPTREQPDALEDGACRFLSKDGDFGTGDGIRHGVVEGGQVQIPTKAQPQMGKHAALRYLGTSFEKQSGTLSDVGQALREGAGKAKDWAGENIPAAGRWTAEQAKAGYGKVKELGSEAIDTVKKQHYPTQALEGIKDVAKTPAGAAALLGGGGLLGLLAAKKLGGGAIRLLRGAPKPPPGIMARFANAMRAFRGH